jgi:hypothetical protein
MGNQAWVLRNPSGGIGYAEPRTDPAPVPAMPKLSVLCESYIGERGAGLSQERADTIRATVRDFIAITTDKPITEYGRGDASGYKETMLGLPGNWKKRKGLREHGIIEAAARARGCLVRAQDHQEEVVDPVQFVRLRNAQL